MVEASHWKRGRVDVEGGSIAYLRTGGDGPPLVLSHGLTDNGLCWMRLADALADRFDVVMLDARGHGKSSRIPDAPFDLALDLLAVVDQLDLEQPCLIGHSMGARTSTRFAGLFPNKLSQLILEDPPLGPLSKTGTPEDHRAQFAAYVIKLNAMSADALTTLGKKQHPNWSNEDLPAWVISKQQVDSRAFPSLDPDWRSELAAIQTPTLLIHGDTDLGSLVSVAHANEICARNPLIQARQVAGAGHNIRRENFEGFLSLIEYHFSCNQIG